MKRWIERALNIQPGDLGRGLLLCSCLFLIISSYVTGRVARDALFLARFQAVQLPYADIASAVLVGIVVFGYVRLGRRTSVHNLLLGSQVFFASNCVAFWALAHYYHPAWLYPAFYVWVGLFGVLAPTQLWTLANYLLTTREAKRVFGMVGGGAILGAIFAGLFSKTVAKAFGTESLLLGMALLLLICTLLIVIAWQTWKSRLADSGETAAGDKGIGQRDLQGSMRLVFSSKYLRAIAAVICLASFVTTLTSWQFKAVAKQVLVNKEALAILFGDFYFYAGILGLLVQLLLTTRLLRRFGIGAMLFVLPLAVMVGASWLLIWGTLAAAVALRGSDQVFRYSLDKSAVELLYLPLPHTLKLRAKWFIDTVIWRLGDGLAGVTVLIFASYLHLTARQMSWVALLLIGIWLVSVSVAGKQYIATLKESITQHRFTADQASALALDRTTADFLSSKILASDPKEILYALSLFEVERERAAHPVIRGLLNHPAPEVRQKAISVLSAAADKSVQPAIELLVKDPDHGVRTEAMLYLVHHAHVDPLTLLAELGDCADYSVRSAVAAYLARPGEAQSLETAHQILNGMASQDGEDCQRTRMEVARLLGELPDSFDPLLATLLRDPDNLVVREAIRSVGTIRKFSVVPTLMEHLSNHELSGDAAQALAKFGGQVVGLLGGHLGDPFVPIYARRAIPPILVSIGTPAAAQALLDNLLESDTTVRSQVIGALNKIHQAHPEIGLDTQLLETVLAAEIMGHYRSYQILESFRDPANSDEPVRHALGQSMQHELERIFRLLGLLYPRLDLHSVYFGLQSNNATVYDNALEFLENVLKSQLRGTLVPLLDGKVSPKERAGIADRLVRTRVESREQAVAELVASDDPWLKSCGAYAIGTLGMKSLEVELNRCLEHPDPLLRETARAAKLRLEALAAKS
ncbi:MAG TPA: Npt1/Npt2 family nucleotide transporter [Candidatus Udaeobacter sp.]|jgi:ATP:ADP antiporter, AAA family|nr:Npt1/Npt2 family nucleotide transporter [Candidatus Udaeobacter sp.]